MMSQNDRILYHLNTVGPIQPMAAWRDLGVYRLASRINDLRKLGHKIHTKKVEVVNRWGESSYIAEYSLELEDAA
jgi:Helix-turn-helix domain